MVGTRGLAGVTTDSGQDVAMEVGGTESGLVPRIVFQARVAA